MKLSGKVALVTGSAQGIGKGIALRLAREGADIVIHALPEDPLADETLDEVQSLGRRGCIVYGDLAAVDDDYSAVEEGVKHLGQLDILVNNAGIQVHAPSWDTTEEAYEGVMAVNLKGVFFTIQAFVKYLRRRKRRGSIINISSVHEELPFPNFASYSMSKGGMKMMMRTLSVELAPFGITINNIAPGAIETKKNAKLLNDPVLLNQLLAEIPLRRMGTPEDVGGIAAFLASPDASYVTGTTIYVDGGLLWNYSEQ
jgi:glucose 1-dehydrogenase